jgi:hypothetical protein
MKKRSLLMLTGLFAAGMLVAAGLSLNGSDKVTIYHMEGNGTWSVLTISPNAVSAHALHGDRWFGTLCPLTGPQNCGN